MGNDKKKSFSFDDDPGALESNLDFTFDDVPVLGKDKDKSYDALFQEPGDEEDGGTISESDRAAASFEALLAGDEPSDRMEDAVSMDSGGGRARGGSRRRAAKRKMLILAGVGVALLGGLVIAGVFFMSSGAKTEASATVKEMTPERRASLEKAKKKRKLDSMLKEAEDFLAMEKPDGALPVYKKVLLEDPRNTLAKAGVGRCLVAMGNVGEAKKILEAAVDANVKDPLAYVVLARVLLDEDSTENADKVKAILMSALGKFPKDKRLALAAVDMARELGDDEVATKAFEFLNVSDLDLEGIKTLGALDAETSRGRARKSYLYGARRFKSFELYLLAVDMSDTPSEKMEILEDALKVLKDDEDVHKDVLRLALAKAAEMDGDDAKAVKVLDEIADLSGVDHDSKMDFLHLRMKLAKDGVAKAALAVLRVAPSDTRLGIEVQRELAKRLPEEKVFEIFSRWQAEHPGNPVAEFLYAKSLGNLNEAIDAYKKALLANPAFYEANLELGKLYMARKKWNLAERFLKKCVKLKKGDIEARRLLALCMARRGKGREALMMMSDFLGKRGLDAPARAAELIDIALVLPNPTEADKLLADLKKDPKYTLLYYEKNAKRKLLFGGASDADFTEPKSGKFRQYYILYLLSKGSERKVLMMPTPKDEFPEFWKTYLARKRKLKSWRSNAQLLVEKSAKDPAKKIEGLIAEMWLGKLSPEDAEKKLSVIPTEKLTLFYFMLGDAYLAKGQSAKAYIRFRRAEAAPRSVETGAVKCFIKHCKGM